MVVEKKEAVEVWELAKKCLKIKTMNFGGKEKNNKTNLALKNLLIAKYHYIFRKWGNCRQEEMEIPNGYLTINNNVKNPNSWVPNIMCHSFIG